MGIGASVGLAAVLALRSAAPAPDPGAGLPRVGERVLVRIDEAQRARTLAASGARPGTVRLLIAAPEDVRDFRDTERSFPRGGIPVGPDDEAMALPSGATLLLVPDRTAGVVLEVKPPDGIANDTTAYRVRLLDGSRVGREVWVAARKLATAAEVESASRKRVARALQRAGMGDRAARVRSGHAR